MWPVDQRPAVPSAPEAAVETEDKTVDTNAASENETESSAVEESAIVESSDAKVASWGVITGGRCRRSTVSISR